MSERLTETPEQTLERLNQIAKLSPQEIERAKKLIGRDEQLERDFSFPQEKMRKVFVI